MHLAYLDDSGSDNKNQIAVFGGIAMEHQSFQTLERQVGFAALSLLTADRVDTFGEFHADDLFAGTGEFAGIPEDERHLALRDLLLLPKKLDAPYFYSAVDKSAVRKSALGSAHPIDIGFRMCALAIDEWLRGELLKRAKECHGDEIKQVMLETPLCLLIVDDCDNNVRGRLKKSFRDLRRRLRFTDDWTEGRLTFAHDAMYFGDSADSVGIQVADACNFIMLRRIRDGIRDEFYQILEPQVRCARVEPEWTNDRFAFRTHED